MKRLLALAALSLDTRMRLPGIAVGAARAPGQPTCCYHLAAVTAHSVAAMCC
jgi:hypothetical protein